MIKKRIRWEAMEKNDIPLAKLAELYFITCQTEGKMPSTIRGYREKLGRFIYWCEDTPLGDLSVELARDYIAYLKAAPKYENHPFHKSNGEHMSAANVQNHVRVLRAFSSWLHRRQRPGQAADAGDRGRGSVRPVQPRPLFDRCLPLPDRTDRRRRPEDCR